MGFKCGIIGLPNVGKSTLFNALTETQKAEAANYPFATIEPNIGRVAVPDQRLKILGNIFSSFIFLKLSLMIIRSILPSSSFAYGAIFIPFPTCIVLHAMINVYFPW